jgi:hypothetical protein
MIIGLSSEQLKRMAISGRQFQKTARRDIAHVVSTLPCTLPFSGHSVCHSCVLVTIKGTVITQMPRTAVICLLVVIAAPAMEILNA